LESGVIGMFSAGTSELWRSHLAPEALMAAGRRLLQTEDRLGRLCPSNPDEPFEDLRQRFAADGYLFLKGLLDPAEVNAFRGWVFDTLAASGLMKPGTYGVDGFANENGYDRPLADRRLMSIVRSAQYEGFCAQPRLSRFMDRFIGGLSYLHKRKLIRFTMPQSDVATAAHYDLIYLRGGTSRLVTAWIPIGDTSIAEGGLIYLKGSHAIGVAMEKEFSLKSAHLSPEERISAYNKNMSEGGWISKDLPSMAEKFDTQWLAADYAAGDVVLHSPFMIHASTNNVSAQGRIRLSTDIRFQNVDDEIDARWNNHWSLDDML
jgi:ectoine hydroxylase-related dioxygenase (phytanoyl-CoA dioxygenase family)